MTEHLLILLTILEMTDLRNHRNYLAGSQDT